MIDYSELSGSSDETESYSECLTDYEYDSDWTFNLLELPPELQAHLFHHLPNLRATIALRRCCRQLNNVYLAHENAILASLRDQIVAPFRDYYELLQRLKFPADSVKYPPPSGWPNFTAEACAGFDKTPFAIDVLRHMPYIEEGYIGEGEEQSNTTNLDYKCNAVDYSLFTPDDFAANDAEAFWAAKKWQGARVDVSKSERISGVHHVVTITDGYRTNGLVLLLDTFTGVIFEEICGSDNGTRLSAEEYFEERMGQLVRLEEIYIPNHHPFWRGELEYDEAAYDASQMESQGEPEGDDNELACFLWLRHLYYKFGWPGSDWKRDECMEAVEDFYDRFLGL